MTVTDETPALNLADFLSAVEAHLRKHPDLPPVNVDYLGHYLQIVGGGEWTDATALLAWAQSFDSPDITAHRKSEAQAGENTSVTFSIRAHAYGVDFEVWGWMPSSTFYLVAGERQTVTVQELAELAGEAA